jgi:hypothetical protein
VYGFPATRLDGCGLQKERHDFSDDMRFFKNAAKHKKVEITIYLAEALSLGRFWGSCPVMMPG